MEEVNKKARWQAGQTNNNMENKTQNETIRNRVGVALAETSGFDGIEYATIELIGTLIGELLPVHWSAIKSIRNRAEDQSVTISLGIEVDSMGKSPKVTAKIGYSERHTDKAEAYVEDPDQGKLLDVETPKKRKAKPASVEAEAVEGGVL